MSYELVTAPDERERCCLVIGGMRCERPSAVRISDAERSWDGYTYACGEHSALILASEPGSTTGPIES